MDSSPDSTDGVNAALKDKGSDDDGGTSNCRFAASSINGRCGWRHHTNEYIFFPSILFTTCVSVIL